MGIKNKNDAKLLSTCLVVLRAYFEKTLTQKLIPKNFFYIFFGRLSVHSRDRTRKKDFLLKKLKKLFILKDSKVFAKSHQI